MKRLSFAALAFVAGIPLEVHAQVERTGAETVTCGAALCDQNWSVTRFGISGYGGTATTGPIVTANAFIIQPVPNVWAPNEVGTQQWIGAAPSSSVGAASRYYFQTTFTQALTGTVFFGIAWDNRLVGAYVGGTIGADGLFSGGTSLLPGVSPSSPFTANGGTAGFCRDGDGIFPTSQYPNCVYNLGLVVNAGQSNTLTFVIEGDGQTDGFLLGGNRGSNNPVITNPTVVPEPSTVALTLAGLCALVAVRKRWPRAA